MKAYIVGAGHKFSLKNDAYAPLGFFFHCLSVLGIEIEIAAQTVPSPVHLFQKITGGGYGCIFVVDEMDAMEGDVARAMLEKLPFEWEERALPCTDELKRLAVLPKECIVINNPKGLSPGYAVILENQPVFILPHHPGQLAAMLEISVLPILEKLSHRKLARGMVTAFGITLSDLEARLDELLEYRPAVNFFCRDNAGEIQVDVIAGADAPEQAAALAEQYVDLAISHLRPCAYRDDDGLETGIKEILKDRKWTMSAAVAQSEWIPEIKTRFQGIFRYVSNAQPSDVREIVLEVPRYFMHYKDGVNEDAAMHMAYKIAEIYGTSLGFSLIAERGEVIMAIFGSGRVTARTVRLPTDSPPEVYQDWVCKHALLFCRDTLEAMPDGPEDAVPVERLLEGNPKKPAKKKILKR